jgi:hypothetical protein
METVVEAAWKQGSKLKRAKAIANSNLQLREVSQK